jgi:DNA polymerase-3 subunit epsilon
METTKSNALEQGPSYPIDCIVLDTETTGFRVSAGHRLVELAMVHVEAGAITREWLTLVHPGLAIPPDATSVHGITNEMIAEAPTPQGVGFGVRFILGDALLGFHNAPFDLPMLQQFFTDAGAEPLTNPVVDTLGLARSCYGFGRGVSNKLTDVCDRLNFPRETAHRALGDAKMTARLLVPLAGWHERHKGITTLMELAAFSQDIMRTTEAKWRR